MVVVFHTAGQVGINRSGSGVSDYTWQLGHLGVAIFFALSGFLLYRPFVAAHLAGRSFPAVGEYFRRRFLRIFPAYWVALAAYAFVFHHPAADIDTPGRFLLFFGLFQTYFPAPTTLQGIPVGWTLTHELAFYLCLPLLALAARKLATVIGGPKRRIHGELALVGGLYLVGVLVRWALLSNGTVLTRFPPAWVDWFAVGMIIAVMSAWHSQGGQVPSWVIALARLPALCWLLVAELMWVVAQLDLPRGFAVMTIGDHMARNFCFGAIGFLAVLPCVFGNQERGPVRWVLRSPPMRYLGDVSYGVYLWHILVMYEIVQRVKDDGPIGFWELFVPTLLISVAVASISWFAVERPILRLKNRPLGETARRWTRGRAPARTGTTG